ncbi:MAG: Gfo/Idh/MocA family oxidoreductase [Planctomycetota bacterium]|nr:Gfo/Idh/MocA family oxidoreductase [Planctomycetota bacterium]
MTQTLRMGMVGGGQDAFIGGVHRMAARLDGEIDFVAGALSSTPEKSLQSGRDLDLPEARNYPTWRAMLEGERALPESDRIDFVSIVTPNHTHFEIAKAFAEAGFHVVCDKPLAISIEQAQELARIASDRKIVFGVTYNYSGSPMIKQARAMVQDGELGKIRKVLVEYHQGWLAERIEATGQKQASWRSDPNLSGGGAIVDIGSHAEQLVRYVTGLEIESLSANVNTFVEGREVDDDINVFLRFEGGAKGVLIASQVCVGQRNDLTLRLWGTKAGLEWRQEQPNELIIKSNDGPEQLYSRGEGYLSKSASDVSRIPPGHPEGFIEGFANVYRSIASAIRSGDSNPIHHDYPDVTDGLKGVQFINAVLESGHNDGAWTRLS